MRLNRPRILVMFIASCFSIVACEPNRDEATGEPQHKSEVLSEIDTVKKDKPIFDEPPPNKDKPIFDEPPPNKEQKHRVRECNAEKYEKIEPTGEFQLTEDDRTIQLTEDDHTQIDRIRQRTGVHDWNWEADQAFKRQRPVLLSVISPPWNGSTAIPSWLKLAEAKAHVAWDVKPLLHLTGDAARDDINIAKMVRGIKRINERLQARIAAEQPELEEDVAPLRLVDEPVLFTDAEDLKAKIEGWLAENFLVTRVKTRSPFAMISFFGHGKTISWKQRLSSHFQPEEWKNESLDLNQLAHLALKKYQAPFVYLPDLCRNDGDGNHDPFDPLESELKNIGPRTFENEKSYDQETQDQIREIELLRTKASPGLLLRRSSDATWLLPTHDLSTIPDKPQNVIHHHCGAMLKIEHSKAKPLEVHFSEFSGQVKSLTLAQSIDWLAKSYKIQGVDPCDYHPKLERGAFPLDVVVDTTIRGKDVYEPIYPNVLSLGTKKDYGALDVVELDQNAVKIIRKQPAFDPDDSSTWFTARLKLGAPIDVNQGVNNQLVLLVSATGPNKNDALRITFGVYDDFDSQLTSIFSGQNSETNAEPLKCDGVPRLLHVPLDLVDRSKEVKLEKIETQALLGDVESNWPKDVELTVHGIYLIPNSVSDDQLEKDRLRALAGKSLLNNCLWDLPLHGDPNMVKVASRSESAKFEQNIHRYDQRWGAVGEVYPRLTVERDKKLRLEIDAGKGVAPTAEVAIGVYSNKAILAFWSGSLESIAKRDNDVFIPIKATGLVYEVAVTVKGHSNEFSISKLAVEN